MWQGNDPTNCYWQVSFAEPTAVGAILQIHGDDEHQLRSAPRNYMWQSSDDGVTWSRIAETVVRRETRLFRLHRLAQPVQARHFRLMIYLSHGTAPAVREVEFYPDCHAEVPFDDWILAVSSLEDPASQGAAMSFVTLARQCPGWEQVPAQCIWHGDFDESLVTTEPRPMCAFLSGSHLEWCQRSREPWRGVQRVLRSRLLPMWGACGGAQVLAMLEVTGVDQPWDCPRCRDPHSPLLPIYSHIGHTGPAPCGDYRQNIGERGVFQLRVVAADPVLEGLPELFTIAESHVGQIDYVPRGWKRLVTKGPGAHTVNQCLRVADYPIYAAQFHIELFAETRENSRLIMGNFLRVAQQWQRDHPPGVPPSAAANR
jgi:hypothetical protein